jgi:hypothetical protein
LKKAEGVPVYQPEREKQVIDHVRSIAVEGPLGPEAVARLFERIIDEARRLERRVVHGLDDTEPFDAAKVSSNLAGDSRAGTRREDVNDERVR